jgi:hypothetical protein
VAAVVSFTNGESWVTNSRTWSLILARSIDSLGPDLGVEYDWFLNEDGLDFGSVQPLNRQKVARWMNSVIESWRASRLNEGLWDVERDETHYQDLVQKLENEATGAPPSHAR